MPLFTLGSFQNYFINAAAGFFGSSEQETFLAPVPETVKPPIENTPAVLKREAEEYARAYALERTPQIKTGINETAGRPFTEGEKAMFRPFIKDAKKSTLCVDGKIPCLDYEEIRIVRDTDPSSSDLGSVYFKESNVIRIHPDLYMDDYSKLRERTLQNRQRLETIAHELQHVERGRNDPDHVYKSIFAKAVAKKLDVSVYQADVDKNTQFKDLADEQQANIFGALFADYRLGYKDSCAGTLRSRDLVREFYKANLPLNIDSVANNKNLDKQRFSSEYFSAPDKNKYTLDFMKKNPVPSAAANSLMGLLLMSDAPELSPAVKSKIKEYIETDNAQKVQCVAETKSAILPMSFYNRN